jgi:hypothetical protein
MFMREIMDSNQKIAQKYNNRCIIDFKRYNHMHHIQPKSLGGKDVEENKVPLCDRCHEKVHAGHSLYWMRFLKNLRIRRLKELDRKS